ncbi:hypothetical protein [Pseudoalteromonas byunsanensis]|uniref:Uncharacterized protein n=1 Tax=Pseudoalteromonas byunsanensis TaxID=327939 RepID=A0A1S1MZB0_9GAMM|nr:hypothetical protein [Pseudoalteromonas byunsanensis]OHU94273.1 hypothetical protein BIW53_14405 [Pseudoalteromonas byunsanensis]
MKKLLISTALMISSTTSFATLADDIDPELHAKLDEAFFLYDVGDYQNALESIYWLDENGVAVDFDFYTLRLGTLLPFWKSLADVYQPARISYNEKFRAAIDEATNNPENCSAYDDMHLMLRNNDRLDEFVTILEEKEAQYPQVWQRCWEPNSSTLAAVEHASKPLIDAYLVDLSDHFSAHFVPQMDGFYMQCNDYDGDHKTVCQDSVKEYLNGVSEPYRHAAMTHYGLQEAEQVEALTLQLLLKWQNQN